MKVPLKSAYARGCMVAQGPDGADHFTARDLIEAPVRNDDMYHTVGAGDTMRRIAWARYRDPLKWKIIADYALRDGHDTLLPDRDLTPGMVLRMPGESQVARLLGSTG
jgi:nucleoid-associated protein YgaU